MKITYQGETGAYGEMAAYKFFSDKTTVEPLPCKSFRDVFESVKTGTVPNGVIPIENSIEGSVNQNYDHFLEYDLKVCGEVAVKLAHVLIVNPQTTFEDIKNVHSHPQALGQCRNYLEKHKWELYPEYDTAGSVKIIKEKQQQNTAAIASEKAADLYNMKIVARDIADNPSNYTRFLVLANKDAPPTGDDKTSIIFSAKHAPGTLYNALEEFASRNINLTRIESRPTKTTAWQYNFYIDFEGHQTEKRCTEALKAIEKHTTFIKILGSYPRVI
ncbi:MAG: prephenate dehydratase [Nitrososphaerota archaeon]|uniref:prephenate dehydratase n=1 Tax=Candidatus Bathycorpusculum sp. TaxID=2994959 RepID=UPI00282BE8A5|nr:prephenate dehydratase [Candidatus Termiticorpusculum sp.]MCL2257502.1 prephenate dehydratase [Candidatus Termiticorpusculum sp.]MCL2292363.1 prephenate dehydratase [Candidatus Termiticorpusculum sp.]MDR0460756.1 prephenate dehydratase [Nitrososphaerota archaeon]